MATQLNPAILGHIIEMKVEQSPDKRVYIFERGDDPAVEVTYSDLFVQSNKLASTLLELGIGMGDKFGLMMRNQPEFLYGMVAASMTGAVVVPIDPRMKGPKLQYQLTNSESKAVIATADLVSTLEEVLSDTPAADNLMVVYLPGDEVPKDSPYMSMSDVLAGPEKPAVGNRVEDPNHPLEIIYTSGTTGDPKGVMCENARMAAYGGLGRIFGYEDGHILYTGLSLTHGNAQAVTAMPAIVLDLEAVISPRFTKRRLWDICRKYNVTSFSLLGGMMTGIYSEPDKPNDGDNPVRYVVSAGTPPAIWESFEERFDLKILEWYAAVEGGFAYRPMGQGPIGSFGKPVPGMLEMKIVDDDDNECPPHVVGEIVSRPVGGGKAKVDYYKNPKASSDKTRGGWLRSGDMGHTDDDGWFFFDYRKGGGLRHNGDFVNPSYVEKSIGEHPDVSEVYVYGTPAKSGAPGEKDIIAAIVPFEGKELDLDSIIAKCKKDLESNFVPSYLQIIDEMPKTISEKPQERILLQQFSPDAANVYCYD